MTVREHADSLFALLSSKLGEGVLALDDAGSALFSIGDTLFTAGLDEEAEILVLSGFIGQLPAGYSREKSLRELAQANFNWGGTGGGAIGLERNTDFVYLHQRFFLPLPAPEEFPGLFANQLSLTRHWAGVLEEMAAPPDVASAIRV